MINLPAQKSMSWAHRDVTYDKLGVTDVRARTNAEGIRAMGTDSNKDTSRSQPLVGVILTVLAVLLLAGVATFAAPCGLHGANVPSCIWAARAVLGIGAVALILALVRIFEMDEGERRGLSLSCALLGFLAALVPGLIIVLCDDASMSCNTLMRPFVLCIGVLMGLVGAIDLTRRLLALRS